MDVQGDGSRLGADPAAEGIEVGEILPFPTDWYFPPPATEVDDACWNEVAPAEVIAQVPEELSNPDITPRTVTVAIYSAHETQLADLEKVEIFVKINVADHPTEQTHAIEDVPNASWNQVYQFNAETSMLEEDPSDEQRYQGVTMTVYQRWSSEHSDCIGQAFLMWQDVTGVEVKLPIICKHDPLQEGQHQIKGYLRVLISTTLCLGNDFQPNGVMMNSEMLQHLQKKANDKAGELAVQSALERIVAQKLLATENNIARKQIAVETNKDFERFSILRNDGKAAMTEMERRTYRAQLLDVNSDVTCKQLLVANRSELFHIFNCYMDTSQKAMLRKSAHLFSVNFRLVPEFLSRRKLDLLIDELVLVLNEDPTNNESQISHKEAPLTYLSFLNMLILLSRYYLDSRPDAQTLGDGLNRILIHMDSSDGKQKMGGELHRNAFTSGSMAYIDSKRLPDKEAAINFSLQQWLVDNHIRKKLSPRGLSRSLKSSKSMLRSSSGSSKSKNAGSSKSMFVKRSSSGSIKSMLERTSSSGSSKSILERRSSSGSSKSMLQQRSSSISPTKSRRGSIAPNR